MPIEPDQPGGSDDPTRANDPVDPTRAQDPVDPTRAQAPLDSTLAQPAAGSGRYEEATRSGAPLTREPLRREPDDDDRNSAWWLWGLLAAVLIAIVVFALLSQGDDDDDAVGTADQTETEVGAVETVPEDTAVEDTTADTPPEDTAETTPDTTGTTAADGEAAVPEGDSGDTGTVTTEDGTDLLALIQGDDGDAERLAPYAEQDVKGEGVEVLDVVEGEGFWIGTSDQQRIFAHVPPDAPAEVEVGQRITFDGLLEPNPPADSADAHDIPEDRGAEQHRQQGHHIELRSLTTA